MDQFGLDGKFFFMDNKYLFNLALLQRLPIMHYWIFWKKFQKSFVEFIVPFYWLPFGEISWKQITSCDLLVIGQNNFAPNKKKEKH